MNYEADYREMHPEEFDDEKEGYSWESIHERKLIEGQIAVLKDCLYHPNKPGYVRHDVVLKIKELEKKLNKIK